MSGSLIPNAKQQFLDANGNPLAGGFVYYYIPSTTTFKNTYQNVALTILNTNPIILDSAGECIAYGAGSYRQIVTDVNGNLIWDQPTISIVTNDAANVIYSPGFSGSVSRTVQNKLQESVSVKDFGAVGDGVADDGIAIQNAINTVNATGGGAIYFPNGTYLVGSSSQIIPKDNITLLGNGKKSLIKLSTISGFSIFRNSSPLTNFVVDGLSFDGSVNYPLTSQINPSSLSQQFAFYLVDCVNVQIKNCFFNSIARSSIFITASTLRPQNILITNNYFYQGAYSDRVIYMASSGLEIRGIVISNNILDTNGPQYYYDPSDDTYTSGKDAIDLEKINGGIVANNVIKNTSSSGVRIENSFRVSVLGNNFYACGASAINFYNNSREGAVIGNVISGFGAVPFANVIRVYGGNNYYAKEYISSTPADPSLDARFAIWPYVLTNVNTSLLRAYVAGVQLYPFRGLAAISVNQQSSGVSIVGNSIEGDITQTSGKYNYCSDYGYSPVHPFNAGTDNNGINCAVLGNKFRDTISYNIYQPKYMNPVAMAGLNGGLVTFSIIPNTTSLIENIGTESNNVVAIQSNQVEFPAVQVPSVNPNTLDDYEEGTFDAAFSCASGSVTINPSFSKMMYTKIGRLVTITGSIRVSAISSPTGEIAITGLPFTNATGPQTSPNSSCFVRAQNTGAFDVFIGTISFNTSKIVLNKISGGVLSDISTDLTSTSIFGLCISYHATA